MRAIREMRTQVEAMGQRLERVKRELAAPAEQAEAAHDRLGRLRAWRLSSTCRYVGKSWTMALGVKGGSAK